MINYPQNPNVGDEFDTGTVTFMWDGVKWKAVTVGGRTIISYANTESMQNSRPTQTGQRAENRERANAQYELAASGYTAKFGDIVAANGRVWALQSGKYLDLKSVGAVEGQDVSDLISGIKSLSKTCVIDGDYLCGLVNIGENEDFKITSFVNRQTSLSLPDNTDYMFGFTSGNASLTVENITLDGNRAGQDALSTSDIIRSIDKPSVSVSIGNCEVNDPARHAVRIVAIDSSGLGSNITVKNSSFTGINEGDSAQYNPSFIAGFNNVDIVAFGNTFDLGYAASGFGACALYTASSVGAATNANTLQFSNNTVSRLGRRATNNLGAVEFYAKTINSYITDNRFFNCYKTPIRGKFGADTMIISNNTMRDTQDGPDIALFRSVLEPEVGGFVVSGNTIRNNFNAGNEESIVVAGGSGEEGAAVAINGNTIRDCQGGISVDYINEVSISGNVIKNISESNGISAFLVDVLSISGNTINKCDVEDSIRTNNCGNVSITGNTVKDSWGVAYRVAGPGVAAVTANTSTASRTSPSNNQDFRLSGCDVVIATGNISDAAVPFVQFSNTAYKEAANSWSA